jgi:putative ABC transport system permease protein
MELLKLIIKNVFRHKLRAALTILGVAIAMLAFGILRTLVGAWYAGVDAASADRLVTRNKISLIYSLPVAYKNKIAQVPGVAGVAYGSWYGGIYKDKKNFFPQIAISGTEYLAMFPEFHVSEAAKKEFMRKRNAAIAGEATAQRFGWKIGDIIPLQGTIYPGNIELALVGTYKGKGKAVDETVFFFRWDYLNEVIKKTFPDRADKTGWYLIQVKDPDRGPEVARAVDALFKSSLAETLTETEKAFHLGFVSMIGAIVTGVKVISIVVIGIILMVLANTMAMTARERSGEYAVLKTLGFRPWFLFLLISGESVAIAMIGGVLAATLTIPAAELFHRQLKSFLHVFEVAPSTLTLILGVSLIVGLAAALQPALRVSRMSISEGLRHVG